MYQNIIYNNILKPLQKHTHNIKVVSKIKHFDTITYHYPSFNILSTKLMISVIPNSL